MVRSVRVLPPLPPRRAAAPARPRRSSRCSGSPSASALVIAISSLSKGLDEAQSATLDPLAGHRHRPDRDAHRRRRTRAAGRSAAAAAARDIVEANQAVITDLSKLGKPGDALRPRLLPAGDAADLHRRRRRSEIAGARRASPRSRPASPSRPCTRRAKCRRSSRKIQTGGDRIDVNRAITPPTAAEQAKIRDCLAKQGVTTAAAGAGRRRRQSGGGLGDQQGAAPAGAGSAPARSRAACPSGCSASARRSRRRGETLQQVLDPPQTDITSESYTIGGVQLGDPTIGARHRGAGNDGPLPPTAAARPRLAPPTRRATR